MLTTVARRLSEEGTTTKGSVPVAPSSERTRLRATRLRAVSAFGLVAVLLAVLVTADRCRRGTGPAEANASARVRTPIATGQYYPGEPEALKAELKRCLSAADAAAAAPKPEGELIALIVPHSAYKLCGVVAADAYRLLEGKHYDTVVIVGPSHVIPFEGVALSEADWWRTPLGDVPVDTSVAEALRVQGVDVRFVPEAERTEHAIEVEVPFLQETLTDFRIVPVLMRDFSRSNALTLAVALPLALALKRFNVGPWSAVIFRMTRASTSMSGFWSALAKALRTPFSTMAAAFWGMNFNSFSPLSTGLPLTAPINF